MKNRKRNWFRHFAFCLIVLIFVSGYPKEVLAAPMVNTSHRVGLTIEYKILDTKIQNAEFSLYKVASMGEDGSFTLTPEFENYGMKVNGLDSEETQAAANAFYGYVLKDSISPMISKKTNANGQLMFLSSQLYPGMYLLTCKSHQAYGEMCYIQPMLLSLPTMIHDKWIYNIEITPKYSVIPKRTEVSAVIIWRDPSEDKRPESLELQLINADTAMRRSIPQKIQLGEGEAWRYTWSNLPAANWLVVQNGVPDGYTLTTKREDNTFIFINTRYDWVDPNQPSQPSGGGGSAEEPEEKTSEEFVEFIPASGEKLPQTGTLWWPVPILAVSGVVFILVGIIFRKREN